MIDAAFGVLDDARFAAVFGPGSRAEVALTGGAAACGPASSSTAASTGWWSRPSGSWSSTTRPTAPPPTASRTPTRPMSRRWRPMSPCWRGSIPDRPVEAALVWTDGPKLMPVPQAMMDVALAGLR